MISRPKKWLPTKKTSAHRIVVGNHSLNYYQQLITRNEIGKSENPPQSKCARMSRNSRAQVIDEQWATNTTATSTLISCPPKLTVAQVSNT